MAWTNPSARSSGTKITADIWNVDLVANLLALSTHSHSGVAGDGARLGFLETFGHSLYVNTAAVQTFFTKQIDPVLLANGFLLADLYAVFFNNSGAGRVFTFTLNYGAQNVAHTDTITASAAGKRTAHYQFRLANVGATNAQIATIESHMSDAGADNTMHAYTVSADDQSIYKALTVDSTVVQTFSLTAQMATADPNESIEILGGFISGPFAFA